MSLISPHPPRRDTWASTRWSIISNLDQHEAPEWQTSWTYLVDTYRPPMVRYVRRILQRVGGRPVAQGDAEDVVQAFLAACVEKDWLTRADALRGRFRAYVQTLLRYFTHRWLRYERAQKRSPGAGRHVFPVLEGDLVDSLTPEEHAELEEFDRGWTRIAVDRAVQRLGRENERYQIVILDLLATEGEGSPDVLERVHIHRAQFPVLKNRARERFRRLFYDELAQTVGDPDAFEQEWLALQPYVGG